MHGGLPTSHCLQIGVLPGNVAYQLRWPYLPVLLSGKDAQKIRFHQKHGMPDIPPRTVLQTISDGDYYKSNRGGVGQIEVVLHSPGRDREIHFAVLAINTERSAIHLRTFFRSTNTSRSKFKGSTRLHWASGVDYFRGLV